MKEKTQRNKEIFEHYWKYGRLKTGMSFADLGKQYGISRVNTRNIYIRELRKRSKNNNAYSKELKKITHV